VGVLLLCALLYLVSNPGEERPPSSSLIQDGGGLRGTESADALLAGPIVEYTASLVPGTPTLLADIPCAYISPGVGKYANRTVHMKELTERVGFKSVEWRKSGTEQYPKCLVRAVIELLQDRLDKLPFLLLEDDVEWNGVKEITIPEGVDAIWLGASQFAGHPSKNKRQGKSVVVPFNNDWKRVLNMLSGHAILFVSRSYAEHTISVLEPLLDLPPMHKDVVMSRTQGGFLCLTPARAPIFFQSLKYGGQKNTERAPK
jgi:hypothetical protein